MDKLIKEYGLKPPPVDISLDWFKLFCVACYYVFLAAPTNGIDAYEIFAPFIAIFILSFVNFIFVILQLIEKV